MILYLDTSSLVKIYVQEPHREAVLRWVAEADVVATSQVAYPEAMAAFTRRRGDGDLSPRGFARIRAALARQWDHYAVLSVDERAAGALAFKHGLRGFDAIHLEAALALRGAAGSTAVVFSSFDRRLNAAATAEGFEVRDASVV